MRDAIPSGLGVMAAIVGLSDEQVEDLCNKACLETQIVTPANYNAIGQVVVAGHSSAVDRLIVLAEEHGARLAKIIPVSVPCHCPLLKDAAELFADKLAQTPFKTPDFKVISNVDLSIYQSAQHKVFINQHNISEKN